jgi:hypothetical protein
MYVCSTEMVRTAETTIHLYSKTSSIWLHPFHLTLNLWNVFISLLSKIFHLCKAPYPKLITISYHSSDNSITCFPPQEPWFNPRTNLYDIFVNQCSTPVIRDWYYYRHIWGYNTKGRSLTLFLQLRKENHAYSNQHWGIIDTAVNPVNFISLALL